MALVIALVMALVIDMALVIAPGQVITVSGLICRIQLQSIRFTEFCSNTTGQRFAKHFTASACMLCRLLSQHVTQLIQERG